MLYCFCPCPPKCPQLHKMSRWSPYAVCACVSCATRSCAAACVWCRCRAGMSYTVTTCFESASLEPPPAPPVDIADLFLAFGTGGAAVSARAGRGGDLRHRRCFLRCFLRASRASLSQRRCRAMRPLLRVHGTTLVLLATRTQMIRCTSPLQVRPRPWSLCRPCQDTRHRAMHGSWPQPMEASGARRTSLVRQSHTGSRSSMANPCRAPRSLP